MRTLMKLLAVAAIVTLISGVAVAKTLNYNSKDIPVKDSYFGVDRGFLDCTGQIELANGVTYFGDNTGAVNNVSLYSCSSWSETGGEVVYHVDFGPGDVAWSLVVNFDGCDLDVAVLDLCDEDLGCIGVANSSVNSEGPGWNGDVWFVIDGYNGAACAFDITLTWEDYVPPPPVGFCENVIDVYGGVHFAGDTCDGANLIADLDCAIWTENGFEDYYAVFMPAGSSFTVALTHTVDSAMWVLDACAEPFVCLGYVDDEYPAGTETLSYSNTSGADMFVYLVIDSYGTDTCGTYDFTFTSTGGAVANEDMSFGELKATYR